jgi:hypothetical protein
VNLTKNLSSRETVPQLKTFKYRQITIVAAEQVAKGHLKSLLGLQ